MKRHIACWLAPMFAAALLAAQETEPPKPPTEEAKAEETKADETQEQPAVERPLQGTIDIGGRVLGTPGGDFNTYRSVVNLGEGVRLMNADLIFQDPSGKLFDSLLITGRNWGGDPYNHAMLDVEKSSVYRYRLDYRNIAYFNYLPSFANPRLGAGSLLNQRSQDLQRRNVDMLFELRPGSQWIPFFHYFRNSGAGFGITPFVSNGNEYPIVDSLDDYTNHFRGGLRWESRNWHLTLEQGGSTFGDNQRIAANGLNLGNRTTTILGRQLLLRDAQKVYRVRGDSIYSRATVSGSVNSRVRAVGQFLYSRPKSDIQYNDTADGLFLLGAVRFFQRQEGMLSSEASQPRTSGSAQVEIQPAERIRILASWMTDRISGAASAALQEQFFFASSPAELSSLLTTDKLIVNHHRAQAEMLADVTGWLTVRGGYRREWGDSVGRRALVAFGGGLENGKLFREVALGGLQLRPWRSFVTNVDYESGFADKTWFRTSPFRTNRLRARSRWQLPGAFSMYANAGWNTNRNDTEGIDYEFESWNATAGLQWMPGGGKRFSLLGEYSRASVRSDIGYLSPPAYSAAQSLYTDQAHLITGMLDAIVWTAPNGPLRITAGGSMVVSSGSRPSDFFQPELRIGAPLAKGLEAYGDWRYYGFEQSFYVYEGFRSHQFLVGLRFSR